MNSIKTYIALIVCILHVCTGVSFSAVTDQCLSPRQTEGGTRGLYAEVPLELSSAFVGCTPRQKKVLVSLAQFADDKTYPGVSPYDYIRQLAAIKKRERGAGIQYGYDVLAAAILMTIPYDTWRDGVLVKNTRANKRDVGLIVKRYDQHAAMRMVIKKIDAFDAVNTDLGIKQEDEKYLYQFQDYMNMLIQSATDVDDMLLLFAIELAKMDEYLATPFEALSESDRKVYEQRLYRSTIIHPFIAERLAFEETSKLFKSASDKNRYAHDPIFLANKEGIQRIYKKRLYAYRDTPLFGKDGMVEFPLDLDVVDECIANGLREKIVDICRRYGKEVSVFVRVKGPLSYAKKMDERGKSLLDVKDVVGIRILTETEEDRNALMTLDFAELGYFVDRRDYDVYNGKDIAFTNINLVSAYNGPVRFTRDEFGSDAAVGALYDAIAHLVDLRGIERSVDGLNAVLRMPIYEEFPEWFDTAIETSENEQLIEYFVRGYETLLPREKRLFNRLVFESRFKTLCPKNQYYLPYELQFMTYDNYELYQRVGEGTHQKYKSKSGYGQNLESDRVAFAGNYRDDFMAIKEGLDKFVFVIGVENYGMEAAHIMRMHKGNDRAADFLANQFVSADLKAAEFRVVEALNVPRAIRYDKQINFSWDWFKRVAHSRRLATADVLRLSQEIEGRNDVAKKIAATTDSVRLQLFMAAMQVAPSVRPRSLTASRSLGVKRLVQSRFMLHPLGRSGVDRPYFNMMRKKFDLKNTNELYQAVGYGVKTKYGKGAGVDIVDELKVSYVGWRMMEWILKPESFSEPFTADQAFRKRHLSLLTESDLQKKLVPLMPHFVREGYVKNATMRDVLYAIGSGTISEETVRAYLDDYIVRGRKYRARSLQALQLKAA